MSDIHMEISIPTDNDGFVLLKCPFCGLKSENYLTDTKNLNKAIVQFMKEYDLEQEELVFQSRKGTNKAITRQHASYILSETADYVGIKEPISTHSMRKTWGYWAYKGGVSLAWIMEALNHSSIENTRKYLGITQEDLDDVYMSLNL